MIPRYTRPQMASIWSDQERFKIWLEIETLALEKMVELGIAPQSALKAVKEKAAFDVERVLAIEKEVKHDVIAFLTNVAENAGPEARFLHRGMTSSDVLDTALAVQIKRSGELILSGLSSLLESLKQQAQKYKLTPCIGRSHGIHAEPTTFGTKLASWYTEIKRHQARLQHEITYAAAGKISGAVGTFASVPPQVEQHVMSKLGLQAEAVATQVVSRDRHAGFFSALALLASSIEKFSVEIRHLQRTEVREAEEPFTAGQKGSSAMPHKRNPVLSENLTGLARLVRSYSIAAMENVALWHERDISHSSVERVAGPDACILIDFMIARFDYLVSNLQVYPERMLENLEATRGLVFSGTLLNALVDKGVVREEAYKIVQRHALEAWDGGANLYERVKSDSKVGKVLSAEELQEIFDLRRHLQHIDYIFERAFKE
ncbi:MAG: adenylosuccinate lyase [Deltaproteobacteria bacterium]|nr:adenylosuccinate lyase [Deltaproteobacteria bacterium]